MWDLRADAASLAGLVLFDVAQGAQVSFDVKLPPELEVRGVVARRSGPGSAVRLQDWSVRTGTGGDRSLHLRFQSPVRGEVAVSLELVPASPFASTTVLPLPVPQGTATGDGFLAYHESGLDVTRAGMQRLRIIKPEVFAPFWPAASRPNTNSLTYCAAFHREADQPPLLRVQLRPQAPPVQAVQDIRFRIDGRIARMRAAVELTTAQNDLSYAEWELQSPQAVIVSGVAGDDVRSWSQSGNRLLVWLTKTRGSTKLEIFAWQPLAQVADGRAFQFCPACGFWERRYSRRPCI